MTIRSPSGRDQKSVIRAARSDEISKIVDVHAASFPDFFLTFLGRRFLTILYDQIQCDGEGVVLVAVSGGRVVGFVAGVLQQDGFYQRLIKRKMWAFAFAASWAVLRRPAIIPRVLRARQRPADAKKFSAQASLMSVAVQPDATDQGLGQRLVKAFCCEVWQRGAPNVCLVTDRDANDRTNRFYQQLGFQLASTFVTPEGRAMNEYVISLPLED